MSLTAPLDSPGQDIQTSVSPWSELFEQAEWLSPLTYRIANRTKSVAEPDTLLPTLAEDIYRHLFLRLSLPDPTVESSGDHNLLVSDALGGSGLEAAGVEDSAVPAEWSAAKRRRLAALSGQLRPLLKPLWQGEWQLVGRNRGPNRWARKNGIVFQLRRGEIRRQAIRRPFSRPKNQLCQVRIPAERLDLFPGFYFVQQGDPQTGLIEEIDPEPVLRLYWNTDPLKGLPRLLVERLQIPFRMKCRIDLCRGTDRVVLQVGRRHWHRVTPELDAILVQMSGRLRPQTPIATLPLAAGLAIAQGPGDLSSYGRGISRRMAEILIQTRQAASLSERTLWAQSLAPELNLDSKSFHLAPRYRHPLPEPDVDQSLVDELDRASIDKVPISEHQLVRDELIRDGIVPYDVLDFGLEISLLYGRHQNVRARLVHPAPRGVWTDLFIKRADPLVEGSRESLFREQAFFQHASEEPLVDLPAPWLIPPLLFPTPTPDPGPGRRSWLVFPWRSGATPLFQAGTGEGCGLDLGQALATVHLGFRLPTVNPRCRETFGIEPPSTLFLNRPSTSVLRRASGAHLELLRLFQREAALSAALDRRRAHWNGQAQLQGTVIHGDLSAGNMLRQGHRALLVDWEHVRWGDPAFDVGAVLATVAECLIGGNESPALAHARPSLRGAVQGFWRRYQQLHRQCGVPIDSDFLSRVVDFMALRLMQAAWDQCSGKSGPTSKMLSLIQLSAVLLADPQKAARVLFGFPLETDS